MTNIIKRLSDNVVLYAGGAALLLTAQRATNGDWVDGSTTTANAIWIAGATLPAKWIGGAYTLVGAQWTVINQAAVDAAFPTSVVPAEVTMRQARLALYAAGLLAGVDVVINAMLDPQKSQARIEWEYSSTVRRAQPLVLGLAPALGLTSAQLDQLFITAATL